MIRPLTITPFLEKYMMTFYIILFELNIAFKPLPDYQTIEAVENYVKFLVSTDEEFLIYNRKQVTDRKDYDTYT